MATVKEVYGFVDQIAPFRTQLSFDNAGFLVGRGERQVRRILVALDMTREVVMEAAEWGAELILSHHPVIFHPARSITDQDPTGETLLLLAEHGIAAICAHTNLDAAQGGVNDVLARELGMEGLGVLESSGVDEAGLPIGIGRTGVLPAPVPLLAFARQVKERLGAHGVRYVDAGRPAHRVAVGGGACGDLLPLAAQKGCDTFVTADVKYNQFLDAKAMGINLVDAGHFPTENVVCPELVRRLKAAFPDLEVRLSARHSEVFSYL